MNKEAVTKILTISIAAYNVQDYIRQGLDSLVHSKYIDELEIFIVDDGGQDNTLEIAEEYQKKYPYSIFPIHKENGGYGSTVNYSLENATGKYFKLLDGDDWFDVTGLDNYIEALKNSESDVIITPYHKGSDEANMTLVSFADSFNGEEQLIKDLKLERAIGMWAITYKTQLLRDFGLQLPEHTFYTDIYYSIMPFSKAKTIQHINFPVYQYRLGRDGQSVSRESRIKNIDMMATISQNLTTFVSTQKTNDNYHFLFYRALIIYKNTVKTYLLLPATKETGQALKKFESNIREILPELYNDFLKHKNSWKLGYFIKLCRLTDYKAFSLLKLLYPKGFPNF